MAKRLFVGGLPYETTSGQLEELFNQAGKVESVNLITDRYTGKGKGFAFVEMTTDAEAAEAIKKFNGYTLGSRSIVVNEAKPREERSSGGFNRGGDRGGQRQNRW